ncbi:putative transposase, partial [Rhizobium leguminosarum]|nr:putative transposase [Rhizobium leguminosarum]
MSAPTYKNHRSPIEIVARAVWLYFHFHLSLRDVEEMLLDRGIVVSYETIRRWCRKHGLDYARRIRRKAPTKGDVWHTFIEMPWSPSLPADRFQISLAKWRWCTAQRRVIIRSLMRTYFVAAVGASQRTD